MTVCPIAIVVGCKKCPIYSVCPVKSVIGDVPRGDKEEPKQEAKKAGKKT